MRSPWILTKDVLAKIPAMVASGQYANRQAIADALGCKLDTLQVRCSQNGISLRLPGKPRGRPRGPRLFPGVPLKPETVAMLRERAARTGETEQSLARRLIEIIARDNLYDAVLDETLA